MQPPSRRASATLLRNAAAIVLLTGAAACASFGGARPAFAPFPEAVVFTSPEPVSAVLTTLQDSLTARGIAVQVLAPHEGYLETRWFDLAARRSVEAPFGGLDGVVKLRFFVDPVGLHTRVIAESVRRTSWDPSRPARELEVMVPEGHPGRMLMDSLLVAVPRGTRAPAATSTRSSVEP